MNNTPPHHPHAAGAAPQPFQTSPFTGKVDPTGGADNDGDECVGCNDEPAPLGTGNSDGADPTVNPASSEPPANPHRV